MFMPPFLLSWAGRGLEAKALLLPTSLRMPCGSGSGFSACFLFFLTEFSGIIDVLSNVFSIDIDHVSLAIDIIIV